MLAYYTEVEDFRFTNHYTFIYIYSWYVCNKLLVNDKFITEHISECNM